MGRGNAGEGGNTFPKKQEKVHYITVFTVLYNLVQHGLQLRLSLAEPQPTKRWLRALCAYDFICCEVFSEEIPLRTSEPMTRRIPHRIERPLSDKSSSYYSRFQCKIWLWVFDYVRTVNCTKIQ